ncbi:MAG: AAA family ATPase [Bifidobacteriaceae bacterium]|nr:AAA family ATPase [Bifidobacteriaceae bacterium]
MSVGLSNSGLDREQAYIDVLYSRLDELIRASAERLDEVRHARFSGSPQNRSERDAFAALHSDRVAQLSSVEDRLCFGRLDLAPQPPLADAVPPPADAVPPPAQSRHLGEAAGPDEAEPAVRYIGRIGLTDSAHNPILTDWRAPAAEPFYQATARHPMGVRRRRHIATSGRQVVAVEDELFDIDGIDEIATLSGEGALLAALASHRTGRMSDIVATIQREQDRIVRAPIDGPLVVEGGPGTGKTAVALHRAAYLLYTHRERIGRSGVLVIGPSGAFLTYIDHVLPSLGETGVVTATMASLLPGLTATVEDAAPVAAIKGRAAMAQVIRRAIRNRQRLPANDRTVTVRGKQLTLRRADVVAARDAARRSHRPYNQARRVFARYLIDLLTDRLAKKSTTSFALADRSELADDVRRARDVRVAVNLSWMPMTPAGLLEELYANPVLLAAAGGRDLTASEVELLTRPAGSPWTVSDIPLLDEAAELLGVDDSADRAAAEAAAAAQARDVAYAGEVAAVLGGGWVSGEQLAGRWAASAPQLTLADRAARDRTWTYGHVVVDEAQELSPMDWRCVLRRCPSRSMTIVGDTGQTHSPAGTLNWDAALTPIFGPRHSNPDDAAPSKPLSGKGQRGRGWRLERLSINYRTPAAIVAEADATALAAGVGVTPTTAARDVPNAFAQVQGGADPIATALGEATRFLTESKDGRLAIIAHPSDIEAVRQGVEHSDLASQATGPSVLDARLAVFTPAQVKGLEFDDVVVLDPTRIAAGPGGPRDLYVAMTRPTQHLRLILPS